MADDIALKQEKWLESVARLPFDQWMETASKLVRQKQFTALKLGAQARLRSKGLVELGMGSVWRWMEPEWFEQAKRENVIAFVGDDPAPVWLGSFQPPGRWVPVCDEHEVDVVIGQRGTKQITERVKKYDYSRFEAFFAKYEAWRNQKRQQNLTDKKHAQELEEYTKSLF
jgi:hypothetical protein